MMHGDPQPEGVAARKVTLQARHLASAKQRNRVEKGAQPLQDSAASLRQF